MILFCATYTLLQINDKYFLDQESLSLFLGGMFLYQIEQHPVVHVVLLGMFYSDSYGRLRRDVSPTIASGSGSSSI